MTSKRRRAREGWWRDIKPQPRGSMRYFALSHLAAVVMNDFFGSLDGGQSQRDITASIRLRDQLEPLAREFAKKNRRLLRRINEAARQNESSVTGLGKEDFLAKFEDEVRRIELQASIDQVVIALEDADWKSIHATWTKSTKFKGMGLLQQKAVQYARRTLTKFQTDEAKAREEGRKLNEKEIKQAEHILATEYKPLKPDDEIEDPEIELEADRAEAEALDDTEDDLLDEPVTENESVPAKVKEAKEGGLDTRDR